jgi:hypothetical protein
MIVSLGAVSYVNVKNRGILLFHTQIFKTKKINDDVSLIFGTHKEGKDELVEGGNIVSDIIDKIGEFLLRNNPFINKLPSFYLLILIISIFDIEIKCFILARNIFTFIL